MKRNSGEELLKILQNELDFLEHGGYRRPCQNPWKANSMFIDSPTCINQSSGRRTHSCAECPLMQFVPPEGRKSPFPCHHIPLTEAGDTVNSVERWGNQEELEVVVEGWLRKKICDLELRLMETRGALAGSGSGSRR